MTHSLDVTELCVCGAGDTAAAIDFMDSGSGRPSVAGANGAGEEAVDAMAKARPGTTARYGRFDGSGVQLFDG